MRNILNIIGVALIASGAFLVGYQSFSSDSNFEGAINLSPLLGGVTILAGIALLLFLTRRT